MQAIWPALMVGASSDWYVVWKGTIHTLVRPYEVRIQLIQAKYIDDNFVWGGGVNPQVWVRDPDLKLRDDWSRLPHTYWCSWRPDHQASLCLYFHDEWSQEEYVADTIIPWTGEWLHFYEGWRLTGEWHGGGVHPGDEEYRRWEARSPRRVSPQNDVRPGPYRRSVDNYVGQRTGTFASFALMAAASRGSTRPPSWRDWKRIRWAVDQSAGTSTWSPGLPLAA